MIVVLLQSIVAATAAAEMVVEGAVVVPLILPVELQVPERVVVVQLILGRQVELQVVQEGAVAQEEEGEEEEYKQTWGPPPSNP